VGTYRSAGVGRWFYFLIFGLLGVGAVVVVVQAAAGGEGPSLASVVLGLLAYVWNAYWWLLRIASGVTLRDGVLEWEAPLRTARIASADVTAFRPVRLVPQLIVIRHRGGRPVIVLSRKGIGGLAAALRDVRPDLDVRIGGWGWLAERLPGLSAWRRDD
jgi:hypothetical protein